MFRTIGLALAGFLLIAGTAIAEPEDGGYDKLSPGSQKLVDALFEAQRPAGGVVLNKDQIAVLKATRGWGTVFRQMKKHGYFQGTMNLGQVISSYNLQHRTRQRAEESPKQGADGDVRPALASGRPEEIARPDTAYGF